MTKEEIQSKLEAAEKQLEEIENLKVEIENLKSKLNKIQDNEIPENEIPEFPCFKIAEGYWYVNDALGTDWRLAVSKYGAKDYNSFHFYKYAQFFANKCRELAMLLHCKMYVDRELVTDSSNDFCNSSDEKWCVWYDHHLNRWTVVGNRIHENTTIYFTTGEAAQKAADWMNKYAKRDGGGAIN